MADRSSVSSLSFRPDIEGLRGIAILLVILYHAYVPGVSGGYVGVDVFFVISGYLITGLLARELAQYGKIDFAKFYARRVRRLLPASALVTVATLFVSFLVFAPMEQPSLIKSAASSMAYLSNIRFARLGTDYLAPDSHLDPFLHTWSLGVEEQFYLIWPAVLFLVMRCMERGRKGTLPWVLSLLLVSSFCAEWWLTRTAQNWAFFSSPTRLWEFGLGGITQVVTIGAGWRSLKVVPWAGFFAILVAAVTFSSNTPYPGVAALLPVLGSVAILAFRPYQAKLSVLLENSVIRYLGRISYSWYLWHWPILVLAQARYDLNLPLRIWLVLVALALAAVTYVFVENPCRFHPFLVPRSRFTLALGFSVMLAGLCTCWVFSAYSARRAMSPAQIGFSRALSDLPEVYSDGCHLSYRDTVSPECAFGNVHSDKTIVLFGDSHAAQWFPALESIAAKHEWKLISLTKSGCSPASIVIYDKKLMRYYDECRIWRERVIQKIIELRPMTVIVSTFSATYLTEGVAGAELQAGLANTLGRFKAARVGAVLLRDLPSLKFDPTVCLARAVWQNTQTGGCRITPDPSATREAAQVEDGAARRSGVPSLDISEAVCVPGNTCSPVRDGIVVYRDSGHVTATFSRHLSVLIGARLMELLNDPKGL